MWLQQRDDGINTHAEEIVFGTKLSKVMLHVKQRKPRMDKKKFKENVNNESAPMEAVQHISAIEESFFHNGISKTGGNRVIHAALRDRFTFLATMCGLLRGETLFKAELSDVFRIIVKKDEDPHPLFVMMM